jgi:predicted nucleic acid-binding protein
MNSQQAILQSRESYELKEEFYVLDTYAWVEYFRKSPLSDKVESILETGKCFTPTIVIAELQTKFLRDGLDFTKAFNFIEIKTPITTLNKTLALSAGKINFERKKINPHWSLADSIVLATARETKAKVVTGDGDFKDLENEVIMLE